MTESMTDFRHAHPATTCSIMGKTKGQLKEDFDRARFAVRKKAVQKKARKSKKGHRRRVAKLLIDISPH